MHLAFRPTRGTLAVILISTLNFAGFTRSAIAIQTVVTSSPVFQEEFQVSSQPYSLYPFSVTVLRNTYGESRGVYEFPLPAFPIGSTLTAASLDLELNGMQSNQGTVPNVSFHGYQGDGSYSLADGLASLNELGRTGPINDFWSTSVPLNSSYITSLQNANAKYLGIMARAEVTNLYTQIAGPSSGMTAPALKLTADVPNAGTLVTAPYVDAMAEKSGSSYSVTSNDWDINTQYLSSAGVDRRGIVEYWLGGLPQGATITSASITFDVNAITSNTGSYPQVRLFGYAGNGTVETADALHTSLALGTGAPVSTLDPCTVTLDPAAIQSLLQTSSMLGITALGSANGQQFGFWSLESGYPAMLSINYVVPEPGSALLLLSLAPLFRRRR